MKKTTASLNEIAASAPLVIAQRMTRMMLPDAMKTSADRAEYNRMVAEKTKAATDGIMAAQLEMSRQMMSAWSGMMFGKISNPMLAADAIAEAALKPMRAKVKSNLKRLTK